MRQSATPVTGFEPDSGSTTTDVLLRRLEANPEHVAFLRPDGEGDDRTWEPVTMARFVADVRALAKGIIAAGIEPGERVGIFGKTSYEWTLSDYAIWFAGAVTVPFYDSSSVDQLTWMITDAEVRRGFVESEEHAERVRRATEGQESNSWVWGSEGLEAMIAAGESVSDEELEARRAGVDPASPATLIYTSGTTGKPKGCTLSHNNFILTGQAAEHQISGVMGEHARCLLFLPLAHVFARFIQVLSINSGTTLALEGDLKKLVPSLGQVQPTYLLGVPRVFEKVFNAALANAEAGGKEKIFRKAEAVAVAYSRAQDEGKVPLGLKLQYALFDKLVYGKLRDVMGGRAKHAVSGGGPLGEHLGHFFKGIGLTVLEGYGLTETTAPITVNIPDKVKIGTVGAPLPGCAVAIAPDGEVLVKGVAVFDGYWRNEEATAGTFADDWFATGDIGELDEDGYLRITGRKKELIVTSGGKNVAPAPLEDALRRHPIIGQPVVIGENRKFISALIFLDSEMLPTWLANHHLPEMSLEQAASDPKVHAAIEKAVERVNATVSKAEGIKSFRVMDVELSEDNGYLSAKQSVKRHLVNADFAEAIEEIYSAPKPE
ncbi:AMP-dependent synthetase/ligase [Brevibacterium litoralis]|uniref:AMP-dependent synthetase/ligase n=1 Tax=Brevibacterium litoralis TaxID=3138935 RepID=UPI003D9A201A